MQEQWHGYSNDSLTVVEFTIECVSCGGRYMREDDTAVVIDACLVEPPASEFRGICG